MKSRKKALLAVFGVVTSALVFFLDKGVGEAESTNQFLTSSANSFLAPPNTLEYLDTVHGFQFTSDTTHSALLRTHTSIHNGHEGYI